MPAEPAAGEPEEPVDLALVLATVGGVLLALYLYVRARRRAAERKYRDLD